MGTQNAWQNEDVVVGTLTTAAGVVSVNPGPVNIGDTTAYTVLSANSGRVHIIPDQTANCTISLPTAAEGLDYTFIYGGVAQDGQTITIDTGSDTNFYLGGVTFLDENAGGSVDEVAPAAPDGNSNSKMSFSIHVGTTIRMICDGTNWFISGFLITPVTASFADQ